MEFAIWKIPLPLKQVMICWQMNIIDAGDDVIAAYDISHLFGIREIRCLISSKGGCNC